MINNNKQRIDFWTKVLEDLAFKRYTTCIRIFQLIVIPILITMSDCLKSDSVCVYVIRHCVLCVCVCVYSVCDCVYVIKYLKTILLYPAVLHVIFS